MNWKHLKTNPPQDDDVEIVIKDAAKPYRGIRQYELATFYQPDTADGQPYVLFNFRKRKDDDIDIDLCDIPDTLYYITLPDIL